VQAEARTTMWLQIDSVGPAERAADHTHQHRTTNHRRQPNCTDNVKTDRSILQEETCDRPAKALARSQSTGNRGPDCGADFSLHLCRNILIPAATAIQTSRNQPP